MSIFKKTKAYEVENLTVVEHGKTNGVSPDNFIVEKTGGESRKIKPPDNVTKIYINNN